MNPNDPASAMTKREAFTMAALTGLLAKLPVVDQEGVLGIKVDDKAAYNTAIGESAVFIADATLSALGTPIQSDREKRLEEVLRDIRDMPEYDQDDAHRLRDKARAMLAEKGQL